MHLDDHLWKFSLSKISISTKRGRVFISPIFPKIFREYYNNGWLIVSGARYRLTKGNSSMRNFITEKAREFGAPVILVNPSHTFTICPVHGTKIVYQPDGSNAPRVGVCEKGREKWHRDVVALYNLRKRAGDVSPVPLGSKEPHDPPTLKAGRWLRAKSLHSIMIT